MTKSYYQLHRERILAWRKQPEQVAKFKAWRAANPDKCSATNKRSKARHPETWKAYVQSPKYKKSRQGIERRSLLKTYGLTEATYEALLASQDYRCALCSTDKPGGHGNVFHVDHCHDSNKVRALLCSRCNTAIGLLQHDPARAFKAAQYLLKHQTLAEVS